MSPSSHLHRTSTLEEYYQENSSASTSIWFATWSTWTCGLPRSRIRLSQTMALYSASQLFQSTFSLCTRLFGKYRKRICWIWPSEERPTFVNRSRWICTWQTHHKVRCQLCSSTPGETDSRQDSITLDLDQHVMLLNSQLTSICFFKLLIKARLIKFLKF